MGEAEYKEFKKLVHAGIPAIHRAKIWHECSGAYRRKKPGYYQELIAQHEGWESVSLSQIELDLHRTLPNHEFFEENGLGIEKLRRVLVAFSWHNPSVGYCQGMNLIAAVLLLVQSDEEYAFWTLVCIIENILPSDYYTGQLLVSQADQRVLKELVKEILPRLDSHFCSLGVDLGAVTFSWFLTIYTDCIPMETLLRVWDNFFVQGVVSLFRVAVALLKTNEQKLLRCQDSGSVYHHLKSMTLEIQEEEKLIKVAFVTLKPYIKHSVVQSKRDRHICQMKQEFGILDDATGEHSI
ncbi:TBC-domain-containing protein [Basidiobolus meristosporus CBS 931.73]|uniref:TBC-domain-containing protein n=1 Tax=Basidiobolus meristosporus CBS 931.73 TaxID=1314790 RepID=A0A1Y1XU10_9FUNG|nr:TBC-domain-containing protein [Basidiobolus meristosporus CBS 931.73]|eukprot:ORX89230.1 TBC-domain-containing protein [Basidiobolus meristosporus CBS 931.73]